MLPNAFSDYFAYMTQLMNEHASLFEAVGNRLFTSLAIIVIVWFGAMTMARGFDLARFLNMVLSMTICLTMLRFYSAPIPGVGSGFYHLIVDQGTYLAGELNKNMVSEIMQRLDNLYWSMETPGLSAIINIVEVFRYGVIVLAIVLLQSLVFAVIAWGYFAVGVAVLLGPLFIPWFFFPKMEWLFWGWLRALLQYAFYGVVANAYVYVFGQMLIHFTDRAGSDFNGAKIAVLFVPLLFLLMAAVYGALKVSSLVNSLFTGKSGESAFGGWA